MPFRKYIQGFTILVLAFVLFIINSMFVEWQILSFETRNEARHLLSSVDRTNTKTKQAISGQRIDELEKMNREILITVKDLQKQIKENNR